MAELDFLDKYCKTKKIQREHYEPFCDLITKLHECNTSAPTVFWRNVNNLNDMKHYRYKDLNITQEEKIEIIKSGFEYLINGNSWISKTKVLSQYKKYHPFFNIETYPFFIEVDNPYYKSAASMKLYLVGMIEKFISIQLVSILVKEYEMKKEELEQLDNETLLSIFQEKIISTKNNTKDKEKLIKKQKELEKTNEKERFFQDNIERFLVSKYQANQDNVSQNQLPKRLFECYLGNTNSGKTYQALEKVKQILNDNPNANIAYLAPLRLLALEIYEKMNSENIPCSLYTGDEEIVVQNARIKSCTVEMLNEHEHYDLIIVDEYQMYSDTQRGSAWYKAFVNANCEQFIMIGTENALFGLVNLMHQLSGYRLVQSKSKFANVFNKNVLPFEPVFKIHYFKRICPISYQKPIGLKNFQSGDCLVTFSKNKVYQYADILKNLGYKVSILYGDLPLETRIAQSENFKNGLTDILVSTDVIGMGLNLPIKRLIFETMDKFDGSSHRPLTSDEFKQIAGRSGRYQQTGEVAYMNASGLEYSPYYRCIVFHQKKKKAPVIDYDDEIFDDFYDNMFGFSEKTYPIKRYIMSQTQIQSMIDEMNSESEIMMQLDNQEFTTVELMEKLSQSNYPCYSFMIGLNINLLEEYQQHFKLGFSTAHKDYVKFVTKELNDYSFGIKFQDNTLTKTLKHFNQIFKKNKFDCDMAIGLCQAPINEDLEDEYMTVLSKMFDEKSKEKQLKELQQINQFSVSYAKNINHSMKYLSIEDSSFGILEKMMIMNAWLHKKLQKIFANDDYKSSQQIKDIRKDFAKEIQIKISKQLIAEQLFVKYKNEYYQEYGEFELKINQLTKQLQRFHDKYNELNKKIRRAKRKQQYERSEVYQSQLNELVQQHSNIENAPKEIDKLKKEQFDFINKKVMEELKKYY